VSLAVTPTEPQARAYATTFLVARRHAILARAEESLAERAPRYLEAGLVVIHTRLDALFGCLVESVAGGGLCPLLEHAESVADDRFHSGFGLGDVQAAYNALEEAVWIEVFAEGAPERHAAVLPLVSGALGAAKDELARRYVALASDARAPAVDIAALFRGLERP
jgi:hypothetical protein